MTSAFSYGRARRPIFIEVPAKDPRSQLDGVLAKVAGSLYGTRDAPVIWQDCLRCQMKVLGYKESLRIPCMFYHETKDVEMIAHVDVLFEVRCLKDVQDVCHGFAPDQRRETVKLSTWGGELFSQKSGWKSREIQSMQPFYSKRLEWKCACLGAHPMLQTRSCWILWQATPDHTCHPLMLEDIGAQWHVWSTWPRIVRISMLWRIPWRKRRHIPSLETNGAESMSVRQGQATICSILRVSRRGSRSWWCKQTVVGHRARPLAG